MGTMNIHSTALVSPDSEIDDTVEIGAYAIVESNVRIADGCSIGPHALIASGTRLGSNCRIFNGASVGTVPQDLKFDGEHTLLEIGDNTVIREFCTLNRGTSALGKTSIGKNCLIMAYCHVAHDCRVGDDVIISNNLAMAGHVEVGSNVTIGGVVAIHQFCRIGDFAFIGATSYLNMDVVPYALCAGNPPSIRSINKIGLERRGFNVERQRKIKRAYRMLFKDHPFISDAIDDLCKSFGDDPDIRHLIEFAKNS
ncbi:MAG: acyl-ACP--UDP-N-acetylglucosamine O-acyltransferase, partial [Chitinivibrionales bacterium]|nr:acyl-ACP--UDP-N-acetylglucosamine O-acyltransferase [Chitinivibrionales bacterium]